MRGQVTTFDTRPMSTGGEEVAIWYVDRFTMAVDSLLDWRAGGRESERRHCRG